MAFIVLPGADASGNGNDWTANNINNTDSTATTYDIMSDVPTLTDEDTANYPVYDQLTLSKVSGSGVRSISAANLYVTNSGPNGWSAIGTTIMMTSGSGKWYWEVTCSGTTSSGTMIGIHRPFTSTSTFPNEIIGYTGDADGYGYYINGNKYNNSSSGVAYGASYTAGDVIGVALDMSTAGSASITFYKNNTSQGVAFSSLTGDFFAAVSQAQANGLDINFGQRPFAYTPPTGYKKLNTYNLPDSSIKDGSEYFNSVLYTGTGEIHNITGVGFQPDFTIVKSRSDVASHNVYDSVRGIKKILITNGTDAEVTEPDNAGLDSFDTDGFTIDAVEWFANVNILGKTYVAWNWKAGDTAVSNTDGTITSTVSANPTSGFSVVSYTGTGNDTDTIGHGLGVTPSLVFWKSRSITEDWLVTSTLFPDPEKNFLKLNLTNAIASIGAAGYTLNSLVIRANTRMASGTTYIAYCFAEVEGYSKFGSYTGNGSTDGPFVYTGFRPAWIMFKRTDVASSWEVYDAARDPDNVVYEVVQPNNTQAEITVTNGRIDFTSNGVKLRDAGGSVNGSGNTFIYMAFAENPMKHSLAR